MSLSRSGSLTWSSSASSLSRRGLPGAYFAPLSEYLSRLFGLVIGPLSSVLLVPWACPDIRGQVTLKLLAMGCFAAHSSSETPGVVDIPSSEKELPVASQVQHLLAGPGQCLAPRASFVRVSDFTVPHGSDALHQEYLRLLHRGGVCDWG